MTRVLVVDDEPQLLRALGINLRARHYEVRVADEGPGIPLGQREKVFEPFYRGREEPERPGSGLGLSIARAVVTAHGGRIWVEETAGGGTALVLDLPIEEEAA